MPTAGPLFDGHRGAHVCLRKVSRVILELIDKKESRCFAPRRPCSSVGECDEELRRGAVRVARDLLVRRRRFDDRTFGR